MDNNCNFSGILDKGYGIFPRLVGIDPNLTINSKAIYALICSFAGSSIPSLNEMCEYLGISSSKYLKCIENLTDNGYLTFDNSTNSYVLLSQIEDTSITIEPITDEGRDAMFKVLVLKEKLGDVTYNTWIGSHTYVEFSDRVEVRCMNSFMAGQLLKKYKHYIEEVFQGKRIDIINESGPNY